MSSTLGIHMEYTTVGTEAEPNVVDLDHPFVNLPLGDN